MSIEITVKVRVPEGETCRHVHNGCLCDFHEPSSGRRWCSLFDDEVINKCRKCSACLKACEEAVKEAEADD